MSQFDKYEQSLIASLNTMIGLMVRIRGNPSANITQHIKEIDVIIKNIPELRRCLIYLQNTPKGKRL